MKIVPTFYNDYPDSSEAILYCRMQKGWNKYALNAAFDILKDKNIRAVITSSPPHSTQLAGLKLKKKTNIKWIADLRDPWTDIYYSEKMYQTSFAVKINLSMERKVLNCADRVITTCKGHNRTFLGQNYQRISTREK